MIYWQLGLLEPMGLSCPQTTIHDLEPARVLVDGNQTHLIRKRESLENILEMELNLND